MNDATSCLPKAPLDAGLVDGKLYVAIDVGVFASTVRNPDWRSVGHRHPAAHRHRHAVVENNSTLYAATLGMGVWSVTL
ncbi:MAG: hypothetical protein WKF54_03715 [Nocardioidaceae bacterium]